MREVIFSLLLMILVDFNLLFLGLDAPVADFSGLFACIEASLSQGFRQLVYGPSGILQILFGEEPGAVHLLLVDVVLVLDLALELHVLRLNAA